MIHCRLPSINFLPINPSVLLKLNQSGFPPERLLCGNRNTTCSLPCKEFVCDVNFDTRADVQVRTARQRTWLSRTKRLTPHRDGFFLNQPVVVKQAFQTLQKTLGRGGEADRAGKCSENMLTVITIYDQQIVRPLFRQSSLDRLLRREDRRPSFVWPVASSIVGKCGGAIPPNILASIYFPSTVSSSFRYVIYSGTLPVVRMFTCLQYGLCAA